MVSSTCSSLLIIEPKTFRASHVFLQVATGIVEVVPGQPFYELLANLSENQFFISRHMIIAHTVDKPQLVAPTEVTLLEPKPDTIAARLYKSSVYRDSKMSHHKAVEQRVDENFNHN